MPSELFLTALIVQCSATLFLFLVFFILFRHSKQAYFGYWTAAWFCLGTGLTAVLVHLISHDPDHTWPLLSVYHASLGVTGLLAFFARSAFLRGSAVPRRAWLYFIPVGLYVAANAAPDVSVGVTFPGRLFFALSLWASGSVFWRLARIDHRPGAGFLATAFGLWGLQQAHYVAACILLGEAQIPYVGWVGFVDTALVMCVALGMILFSLDEDRSRLLESNRKLEISEHQLKDLAMRDPLTGLFNRRHFDNVAPQMEAQARRMRFPVTLFLIDLNNFKETNDRDGHHRGDQILWTFAEFLRRETRASDLPFRWGGDEFLVLMTNLPAANAADKARELQDGWERVRAEVETDVTLAVGWAPLLYEGIEGAIRAADRRMYGDKRAHHQAAALAAPAAPVAAPAVAEGTPVTPGVATGAPVARVALGSTPALGTRP
ncbi:MAG TPA: GGDEF domain-containing protein [Gemmatimonadota bacterium]|jgi:diguanylate cyclase (GGDEF)-like protein